MPQVTCLVGCGILKNEVRYLIKKNDWELQTRFACSSLHVNYDRLQAALQSMLDPAPENTVVVYGECHPLIDKMMAQYHAKRVNAQNCIEMLLGKDAFVGELQNGAFFLLEDWARRWDFVTRDVFGQTPNAMGEILRSAHDHFLCLKTPCSDDFSAEAMALSRRFEMPLEWRETSLDILEDHLKRLIIPG